MKYLYIERHIRLLENFKGGNLSTNCELTLTTQRHKISATLLMILFLYTMKRNQNYDTYHRTKCIRHTIRFLTTHKGVSTL